MTKRVNVAREFAMPVEAKHTPGPWAVDDGGSEWTGIFADNGEPIAFLVEPSISCRCKQLPVDLEFDKQPRVNIATTSISVPYARYGEQQANARLIAASPELLEALERVTAVLAEEVNNCTVSMPGPGRYQGTLEQARAAIAKAKGK